MTMTSHVLLMIDENMVFIYFPHIFYVDTNKAIDFWTKKSEIFQKELMVFIWTLGYCIRKSIILLLIDRLGYEIVIIRTPWSIGHDVERQTVNNFSCSIRNFS